MFGRLIPSIFAWLTVVITLALAPTIETYNATVTSNVSAATNSAYMLGMTAVDDFAGFLIIFGLLISGGFFAVTTMKGGKTANIGDMLSVIGAVILTVISLALFAGSVIGYIDALITAGTGFAKTAYGILPIILYVGIISGASAYITTKVIRKKKKAKKTSNRSFV